MRSPKLIATGTARIDMTPMIDVVFLLIIFFMVSSHLSQQENMIPLHLPTAVSGLEELSDRETVIVHILPDGSWMIGGSQVSLSTLESHIQRRLISTDRPLQLRIRTDRTVPYEKVEPVLATAARLGVGDVVFSVYGDVGR